MTVQTPTPQQLQTVAKECGLDLSSAEIASFICLMSPAIASYQALDAMADEIPIVDYPRTPGYRPSREEDPRNVWHRKTNVVGAKAGKLQGKRVALKDNVQLAGVSMMNGNTALEGFVPEFDATIVTRILDAGGVIVGKAHCENLCLSGGSHTNATGPTHNPFKMGYSAGGSSSGSSVAVALGEADMAISCDQGGSIRIPASFCGVYGMKPTFGLVPYTGIMPNEVMVDHAGPCTATVADNALMLEVIAGDDGYDSRIKSPTIHAYTEALGQGVRGLRIGIVKEGFQHPGSEEAVNASVRAAAERFRVLGAEVKEVSIPMHFEAPAIFSPICGEGTVQTTFRGDGYGLSRGDLYSVALMDKFRGWRQRANDLSTTGKLFLMTSTYIHKLYGPRYYGKAMNVSRRLRAAYDTVLSEFDLLLMPTTPMKATPLPEVDASREDVVARALEMISNTSPFNITHHPAMTVPCGMVDGLPVGLMLIGKHFDEPTIYRAAHAFEQAGDWKSM
ncbi:amidase [Variovorax sp. J31P207]|uniref:amidase n=1 Tax=Variovorax sp. J31P207 TaxID=3053510 RepID=UPI002578CE51|nr:amidase [Variovorax sp. J31P207]MDM0069957.1 amidase [Variovorax sp. J31P207]